MLLVLGLIGLAGRLAAHPGEATRAHDDLTAGQCITNTDYGAANMAARAVPCERPDALYQLAFSGGAGASCPDGQREDSPHYALLVDTTRTECFTLNLREGSCYAVDADRNLFSPAECTSPEAVAKVAKMVDGVADAGLCGPDDRAATVPEPPKTYCVVAPEQ